MCKSNRHGRSNMYLMTKAVCFTHVDLVNHQIFQWSLAFILSMHVRGNHTAHNSFQHAEAKSCPVVALRSPIPPLPPREGLLVRGVSCYSGVVPYLCGPADLEQVEPVGVPVVDDVGQFPPLLLPAPRHGGQLV